MEEGQEERWRVGEQVLWMTDGRNGSLLESMLDHSLWGIPGWLKDSIEVFGA